MGSKDRIEDINNLIIKIASGDFDHKIEISDSFDEIDAIVSGINMLGEELKESVITRNYLKSIFEGIVDMLIIFDKHFFVREINKKVSDILGLDVDKLVGRPIECLFPQEEHNIIDNIKTKISHQGSLYNQETTFIHKKGFKIPVSLSLSVLKDKSNHKQGYILIAKDLKQVLLTSEALKQKNIELQTLVYKVSHDLKGPVATAMGLLELADMAGDDFTAIREYLSLLKNSLGKLNQTILDLFEYSLSSKPSFEHTHVLIKTLFEEILVSNKNFPGIHELDIHLDIPEDLSICTGKKMLISIFQQLLENAIHYRAAKRKHPSLKITVFKKENNFYFKFKDNGIGMDTSIKARAFDMFYRGNECSKGSGLGLFITKSNVEKLGGEINIESIVDVGTEITILLPSLHGSKISIS